MSDTIIPNGGGNSNPTLTQALTLADLGLVVFPVEPANPRKDKRPYHGLGKGGFHNASASDRQIRAWFDKWPDARIGVVPGKGAWPLAVIDVDVDKRLPRNERQKQATAGGRYISAIAGEHGSNLLAIYETESGGRHMWFKLDGNDDGAQGAWQNGDCHGDVRHRSGYVLVHKPDELIRALQSHERIEQARPLPRTAIHKLMGGKREVIDTSGITVTMPHVETDPSLKDVQWLLGSIAGQARSPEELKMHDIVTNVTMGQGHAKMLGYGGMWYERGWDLNNLIKTLRVRCEKIGSQNSSYDPARKFNDHCRAVVAGYEKSKTKATARNNGKEPDPETLAAMTKRGAYESEYATPRKGKSKDQEPDIPPFKCTYVRDMEVEEYEWIIPAWLARGELLMTAGHASAGKTTMLLNMLAALSIPRPILGYKAERPCKSLYWGSLENSPTKSTLPRLINAGADENLVMVADSFDPREHKEELRDVIEREKLDIVVLDPISAALDGDNNSLHEVRRALHPFMAIAHETNCAIIGIHHFRKQRGPGDSATDMQSGSTAWTDVPRMMWGVIKDVNKNSGEATYKLGRGKGNDIPEKERKEGFAFKLQAGTEYQDMPVVVWEGGCEVDMDDLYGKDDDGRQQNIITTLLLMTRREKYERKEIVALLEKEGITKSPAYRTITTMIGEKLVTLTKEEGKQKIQLTQKGEDEKAEYERK